jgi:hypothetical protein
MVCGGIKIRAVGGVMSARSSLVLCLTASVSLFIAGCGNDCQSTCNKLYGTKPNCGEESGERGSENYFPGLNRFGEDETKKKRQCMDECELAMKTPGEVGDYRPNEYTPSDVNVELTNDRQAAVWMDCVDSHACEKLAAGYCAPVW